MKEIRKAVEVAKARNLNRYLGGETHSDEAADRSLIKKMVKPEARTGRADGGKAKAKPHKGKPSVSVNVIAPQQARPVPVPVPVSGGASAAPGPLPSRAPVSQAPTKVIQVPPPQGPLGPLGAKRGGRIKKRAEGGKITAGADSGLGRLEKMAAQKGKK